MIFLMSRIRTGAANRGNKMKKNFPSSIKMSDKFRLSAKYVYLTYSQCPIPKEEMLEFLKTRGELEMWLIGQERHQDGNFHLHALIKFKNKKNLTGCRFFDYKGYHPQFESALRKKGPDDKRKPPEHLQAIEDYITKEDPAPLRNGFMSICVDESKSYGDIIAEATSADELIKGILEEKPRDFMMNLEKIQYAAKHLFPEVINNYRSPYLPEQFPRVPQIMLDWVRDEKIKPERAKALFLIGPSRLGKTAWARSLGRHIFWRGLFNLEKWDESADYIVVDDVEWDFFPNKKQLLTAMGECEVSDKYKSKRTLYNYKPAIICLNQMPDFRQDAEYWRVNAVFVHLTETLF